MTRTASVLLACLVLAACAESATAPAPDVTPAFAASTSTISVIDPLALTVFVPCALGGVGENVNLTGWLHVVIHTSVSNSGILHAKTHFQPQNLSGTGETSGDSYRGVGVTQDNLSLHPEGFPVSFTLVNNFRMIGQGKGNNFQVHENVHVTVNANGDMTVDRSHARITCN